MGGGECAMVILKMDGVRGSGDIQDSQTSKVFQDHSGSNKNWSRSYSSEFAHLLWRCWGIVDICVNMMQYHITMDPVYGSALSLALYGVVVMIGIIICTLSQAEMPFNIPNKVYDFFSTGSCPHVLEKTRKK